MTPAATFDPWRDVTAARLPLSAMGLLAALRNRADVRAHPVSEAVWIRWPAGRSDVVRHLLPIPGVEFFVERGGLWSRFGRRLPSGDAPPQGEGQSLVGLLSPEPFDVAVVSPAVDRPMSIRVVRGGSARPASALACRIAALTPWADRATTDAIATVRAARCGDRVLLLGVRLPHLSGAVRYWGERLLVPMGFRAEPDLPPSVLCEAIGARADELVCLDESGAECISRSGFEPLTRAAIRLALREGGES